ncbi:restriction endonuclease subunit S [Trichococcus ilyis]|nr:restriction endonuclease subunit S [Trichococcus ilyis]
MEIFFGESVQSYSSKTVQFSLALTSVGFGKFLEKNYKHISYETFNKLNCTEITTNDLLINRLIGDKMLVTLLPEINGKKITSVDVCIMKPNQEVYDSRYMMYAMMSPLFQMQVMAKSSGTTRKRISKNNLVKLLISFPPLEEQKRIVAKIEEIFAIINQIGTKKEEALSIIRNIRQTALQDAIRGVLVEQEENDEPASVLYEKIQAEKEQLVIEKKIKKEKPLLEIDKNEIPFEIPKNWRWTRLGDLGFFKKGPFGSALTKSIFVEDSLESIKVYEQKNAIQSDCTLGEYFITKDYYEEKMASNTVMPGDIIVSCAGTIGKSYIIPDGARLGIINQALMRIRVYTINKQYFRLIFNHVIHTDGAQGKGSAIKNIPPMKVLNNLLVPLPPLAEQERIVEKIDEIMAICDQMEAIFDGSSEVKENFKVV